MSFTAIAASFLVVSSPVPDVYRVDVQPTSMAGTATSLLSRTTSMKVEPKSGRIDIVHTNGTPIWSGTCRPLKAFGRASVPGLELSWDAVPGEYIYGAGERFDALNQVGRKVDYWIKDAPGQDGAATYYCTPVFYSSAGYGIFFTDNPEALADFNSDGSGQHRYQRAGTSATFYVSIRDTMKEQVKTRAALQGPYRGIPDWAWGPWISRNSYENQAEAEEAIRGMIERNMPVAVIVQEAWKGSSETGEFNAFSKTRWPDLPAFLELCDTHGIRNVLWQVPIVHPSYPGFDEAVKKNYFVRKPDGSVSFRKEWLEGFANIDFTNPDAVAYWKDQMRETVRLGIAGFKADDGEDIKPDDVFFDGRRGWEMHNEYSTLYNRALMELLDEENADGMLWARSGSLGIETAPALWAGDQGARWDQMQSLIPAGLSASMSGMPFWGHDIGGYFGDCTPELYIRWLQFGAFSPLMQFHGTKPREPWIFGPDAEAAYKLLADLRMKLKPYLIALGREAAQTGMPIMRPMALEFPDDPRFGSEQTQYMLGPDLLVAPILEEGATARRVKFPVGRWQHLLEPTVYEGPSERAFNCKFIDAPVFVREGALLPIGSYGPERSTITNPPARPSVTISHEGSRIAGPHKRVKAVVRNLNEMDSRSEHVWEIDLGPSDAVGEERIEFTTPLKDKVTASFTRPPRWIVAGPFPAEPKQGYHISFPPEWEHRADVGFDAGFRLVSWQAVPAQHVVDHDGIDFNALFGQRDHAAAYALTYLDSASEQDAELRFGSDDTLTVWLNDKQVHSVETYRLAAYDQEVVKVRLKAGRNKLLVKVVQDLNPWRLMFRLTAPYGAPIAGVTDGFADIDAYDPARPAPPRVVEQPTPLAWKLSGPHPRDGGSKTGVETKTVRPSRERNPTIDLIEALGPAMNSFVVAQTQFLVDRESPVEIVCGSDDGLILQLNGKMILTNDAPRGYAYGSDRVAATLKPGLNTINCRITQGGGEWKFRVEVWDVSVSPPRLLGQP